MMKFGFYGLGNPKASINPRKQFCRANLDQIIKRGCVDNRFRHLQTKAAVGFAITIEIIQGIFQFNSMIFEEGVHLHGSLEPQQVAQLGPGQTPLKIGFQGKGLQRGT
jgi:hypothetical protein